MQILGGVGWRFVKNVGLSRDRDRGRCDRGGFILTDATDVMGQRAKHNCDLMERRIRQTPLR